MRYHNLIARMSEFGVAEARFGWCSPIASLRIQANELSGARVCLPTSVVLFPDCQKLPQVIKRNGIKWWLYTLVLSVPKPPSA